MLADLNGRTAVVTGAASGIGLGLARRCVERGMNVVMLDVEAGALERAAADVAAPHRVLSAVVDVTDAASVAQAAATAAERFGAVHLLCNNAGVSITGPIWQMTEADARWLIEVNLVGVINGLRAFLPAMIERGEPGHVVNTASLAGLVSMSGASLYSATKAAVVALSEALSFDLDDAGAPIGVSVLCPGLVNTRIYRSERNRPEALADSGGAPTLGDAVGQVFARGDDPLDVADRVLAAVAAGDFYVLTNEAGRVDIEARMTALVGLQAPARPRPEAIAPDRMTGPRRHAPLGKP
jgi:NAD(P)-dependent dehydrogenase (short-subunit alcohol dehydrogenase family)